MPTAIRDPSADSATSNGRSGPRSTRHATAPSVDHATTSLATAATTRFASPTARYGIAWTRHRTTPSGAMHATLPSPHRSQSGPAAPRPIAAKGTSWAWRSRPSAGS